MTSIETVGDLKDYLDGQVGLLKGLYPPLSRFSAYLDRPYEVVLSDDAQAVLAHCANDPAFGSNWTATGPGFRDMVGDLGSFDFIEHMPVILAVFVPAGLVLWLHYVFTS